VKKAYEMTWFKEWDGIKESTMYDEKE